MSLKNIKQTLLPELVKKDFGREIFLASESNSHLLVQGTAGSFSSIFVAEYFLSQQKNLVIVSDDKEAAFYMTTELEEMLGADKVLYFPETMVQPYQIEKIQNANIVLRTEVLNRLHTDKKPKVIVTHAAALSERVMKKEDFKAISHDIQVGDLLDFDFTEELLHQFNFNFVDFVSQPGEFSVRGGIVDVFSYAHEKPYRISFFGNEVESIKEFDIETQLSTGKVNAFQLVSNMNFVVSGAKVSFLELMEKDTVIFAKNLHLTFKKIRDFFAKAEENFSHLSQNIQHSTPEELFVSEFVLSNVINTFKTIDFSSHVVKGLGQKVLEYKQNSQPSFHKNFEFLLEDLIQKKNEGYQVWLSFSSEKQKDRLESILNEISHEDMTDFWEKDFVSELHEGFVDAQNLIVIYTDHQIFDRYQRFKTKTAFAKSEHITLKDLMSLKVGDYITHIDHGIGKFMGLVKVNNDGKVQECFKLSYKNGDLLYVSIHALHKISKYNGPDGKEIQLSKLGSPAWKALKQKTKARVKQLAFDLIKLYAKRKTTLGFRSEERRVGKECRL